MWVPTGQWGQVWDGLRVDQHLDAIELMESDRQVLTGELQQLVDEQLGVLSLEVVDEHLRSSGYTQHVEAADATSLHAVLDGKQRAMWVRSPNSTAAVCAALEQVNTWRTQRHQQTTEQMDSQLEALQQQLAANEQEGQDGSLVTPEDGGLVTAPEWKTQLLAHWDALMERMKQNEQALAEVKYRPQFRSDLMTQLQKLTDNLTTLRQQQPHSAAL